MAAAELDTGVRSSYLKKSKQRAYQAKKGKRSLYLLEEGQSGYEVERVQKALKDAGLYSGPIDGEFTPELTEALKKFQDQQQLEPDGVAGPRTLKALQLY